MGKLKYAVHAYAWTTSWSNETLDLIDRAKGLGLDAIEIPLMELDLIDPKAIRERLDQVGLGVCTSTACSESNDITGEDEETRRRGLAYLEGCIRATAAVGATCLSGVIYSAIGRKIDGMPDKTYWDRSAKALLLQDLPEAQQHGTYLSIQLRISSPDGAFAVLLVRKHEHACPIAHQSLEIDSWKKKT